MHSVARFYIPVLVILLSLLQVDIHGQGIKGKVMSADAGPLPFASIHIVNTGHGIVSNAEGEYFLPLPGGKYHLRIQYLGYGPLDTIITVDQEFVTYHPVMHPEEVALPEAVVAGKGEDPAYTIMRRAIAKARYHAMQIDEYKAMVYVKGSGRLIKVPGLFKKKITKALAEEGIDSTVAFTQESVSKLHYIRPDQYRDTVISIRTIGDDNNTSPMGFIYSSFYESRVVNGISPLAPDAFSHYRFQYLGFIEDGGHVVNKIKVIPKGKGDQVFEGILYIVDDVWSIHSLDLKTYIWGIGFNMQQQFEEVLSGVWLPVHEIYDVDGSLFGFGFEYRYFAQLSDYDIKLNPDLEVPVTVLDSKIETEEAKESEEKFQDKSFKEGISGLDPGEELSAKQLRRMLREYEQQEIESLPEIDTVPVHLSNQVIDSSAYHRDSSYWEDVRPMPLTEYEVRGYARQDSLAALPPEPDQDESQDSVNLILTDDELRANVANRDEFSLHHLITGGRYALNKKIFLKLKGPLQSANYNTVDGFHGGYEMEIGNAAKRKINWEAGPLIRYNTARENFNYEGQIHLFGKGWNINMRGGRMPKQFSYDYPVSALTNTTYTLLGNRNYLKEYEQTFTQLNFDYAFSGGIGFKLALEYAERKRLENNTDIVFIDNKKILFTPNDPLHAAGGPDVFNDHTAFISELGAWFKPFWKYRISRGTKRKDYSGSPVLNLRYRKGWGKDNHPFDFISAGFKCKLTIGAGSLLNLNLNAGKFIGETKPVYFADFAHFPGNRTLNTPFESTNSFRMLDYYLYSTNDQYLFGLVNYQFRRFGLTQFEYFRRQGIRENILMNMLFTPQSQQYTELGYAVNYILRFMRVELVTSWQEYKYRNFAVRFGIATDFQSIFGF